MEPLQCGIMVVIAFFVGYFAHKARNYLYCLTKADIEEADRELRYAEAKIISKKIDKELEKVDNKYPMDLIR